MAGVTDEVAMIKLAEQLDVDTSKPGWRGEVTNRVQDLYLKQSSSAESTYDDRRVRALLSLPENATPTDVSWALSELRSQAVADSSMLLVLARKADIEPDGDTWQAELAARVAELADTARKHKEASTKRLLRFEELAGALGLPEYRNLAGLVAQARFVASQVPKSTDSPSTVDVVRDLLGLVEGESDDVLVNEVEKVVEFNRAVRESLKHLAETVGISPEDEDWETRTIALAVVRVIGVDHEQARKDPDDDWERSLKLSSIAGSLHGVARMVQQGRSGPELASVLLDRASEVSEIGLQLDR